MTKVKLSTERLYSGLSGLPKPAFVEKITKFEIPLGNNTMILDNPIQIPSEQAFRFEIEVFDEFDNEKSTIKGRYVLNFELFFNNNLSLKIPTAYLNCRSVDDKLKICVLS